MALDFADTCFWIALANPKDELHNKAVELSKKHIKILTTQKYLANFLISFQVKGLFSALKQLKWFPQFNQTPTSLLLNKRQSLLTKD
jgi:predicted nucleic acid-binding protein